jgi:hypothetical protein
MSSGSVVEYRVKDKTVSISGVNVTFVAANNSELKQITV